MTARRRSLPAVELVAPTRRHERAFLEAVARSRKLHGRFADPPATPDAYRASIARERDERYALRLVVDAATGELAGVVNANEIVRGSAQSAFLGYYAFAPFAGTGRMEAGLRAMLREAFGPLGLHRLEANIQPENVRSIALVKRIGFRSKDSRLAISRFAGDGGITSDGRSRGKTRGVPNGSRGSAASSACACPGRADGVRRARGRALR